MLHFVLAEFAGILLQKKNICEHLLQMPYDIYYEYMHVFQPSRRVRRLVGMHCERHKPIFAIVVPAR